MSKPEHKIPPCYCASCLDWINEGDLFKRDAFDRPICLECTRIEEEKGGG